MTTPRVLILDSGIANLASISAALRRLGARLEITDDPQAIMTAERLVLPGVGAFGPAMQRLRNTGGDVAIIQRAQAGKPILAICLGMQLLLEGSDENPGVAGLNIIPGTVTAFSSGVPSPQFGWNHVTPDHACQVLVQGHCYFANSFKLDLAPSGMSCAWSEHGERFIAGMERPGLLACQFHPELSGAIGNQILSNWLNQEQTTC